MEGNKKIIYCPECGRKVAEHDGKSSIDIKVKCRHCNRLVVYKIDTEEVFQTKVPLRKTGSGLRFY